MPSPKPDHSPLRPSVLAKRGLDAWARPLLPIGTMVRVDIPSGLRGNGLYVEHLVSGHDRRIRHGYVLIRGSLTPIGLNYLSLISPE